MWKGYEIKRGKLAEEFKQYLRSRNIYFEPSENGRYIHFEVENPDEYVKAWVDADGKDKTRFVYEFPEGTTKSDIELAKRLGLDYLGQGKYRSGARGYYIEGTLTELLNFVYEAFGDYELHPDYLCPANEFAGLEELKEAGYFEDGKYCSKDKKVRLQGSKLKDSDSKVVEMAQQELDRLQDEDLSDLYYDDEGNEKDWYNDETFEKQEKINEKAVALCYLIKAYGGVPKISPGWDGLAEEYDGPRRSK